GCLAERVGELAEVRAGGLEVLVRAEGGDDPAGEGGVRGESVVRGEIVDRVVGGGQHGDVELVEQGAGPVLGPGELLGDLVVQRVGGAGVQHGLQAEDIVELVLHPVAGGGAGVGVPVLGQQVPGAAGGGLVQRALAHAEVREVHAAGVHQAVDVVVGRDEQRGRVTERLVVEQQPGVDVPVGRDDR